MHFHRASRNVICTYNLSSLNDKRIERIDRVRKEGNREKNEEEDYRKEVKQKKKDAEGYQKEEIYDL